jgi:membrane-bound lytic murein transglycosylase B
MRILFAFLCLFPAFSIAQTIAEHPDVPAFVAAMQARHGIDAVALAARLARLQPNARALQLVAPPTSPTQRSWQRYRSRFIEDSRIKNGLAFWRKNAVALARARALYGLPEEIIVAIIGVETIYGRNTGSFNTFAVLATLAFYEPRRAEYFRQELEQLLLLAQENRRDPESYSGSYAGAIGLPQFMPGSLRRYAVDFDGDGVIDLAGSADDAIGSVANFLVQHGWQENAPIAVPARVDGIDAERLQTWLEVGIRPVLSAQSLLEAGVVAQVDDTKKVTLVDLVTPNAATEYWLGYDNFYVLTRYNRSSFYAMSVYQLAEKILARQRMEGGKREAGLDSKGKTRIAIWIDDDVLSALRERTRKEGRGYQTLVNETLREEWRAV